MTEVEEKLLEHQSYYNSSVRDCVCTKVPFSEPCCLYGKKFYLSSSCQLIYLLSEKVS